MDWKLDDGRPIWVQLAEILTRRIVSGEYPPGSRLPAVRELAQAAGVNPNTMQRALAQLETDGLAASNRTAGRTVTEDAAVLESTRRHLARQNITLYLNSMAQLGYDADQAAALLKEVRE
jgi:DNA-binding transcriptional regulator YhcF (GntR family)